MASVTFDPTKVHEFTDEQRFHDWLARHHDKENEVWIKIHKVNSGLASITPKQAIDVVLCWSWIDAVRKGWDDKSYLQRYTPRRQPNLASDVAGNITIASVEQLNVATAWRFSASEQRWLAGMPLGRPTTGELVFANATVLVAAASGDVTLAWYAWHRDDGVDRYVTAVNRLR